MKKKSTTSQNRSFIQSVSVCLLIVCAYLLCYRCTIPGPQSCSISNSAYSLFAEIKNGQIQVELNEKMIPYKMSAGNYIYRMQARGSKDTIMSMSNPHFHVSEQHLKIEGKMGDLDIIQDLNFPADQEYFEEHIVLRNSSPKLIRLAEFEAGFPLKIKENDGKTNPELLNDRIIAVPFRHRADDDNNSINDFSLTELAEKTGWEYRPGFIVSDSVRIKSRHHFSEGWAWTHGNRILGIYSFCQDNLVYSVLSQLKGQDGLSLRFGGACYMPIYDEPSLAGRIEPGDSVDFGIIRYYSINGEYNDAACMYRTMLDEKGCHFPEHFDPPVHWEQLYDMEGAWNDRIKNYTKERILKEAEKGVDFNCEALYLDPGWDTKFGTFIWGKDWLGPEKEFIDEIRAKYGLKVSLHTPMPPWSTLSGYEMGPNCVQDWPEGSRRMPPPVTNGNKAKKGPEICMGSEAFLDEAEKRLLANCEAGVSFLMYDGTGWNCPCIDSTHGHPVPYLHEDHMRNCIDLVKRVHEKYPDVLIELHDMLDGGSNRRMTPVYYKYGLPGSYDDNWGFELMWNPMEDIKQGRGLAMYYYNLACNIPIYLHIDLRKDNKNCVMLWWFASTARHLGIGGTNKDPETIAAQKQAMKYYHKFERYFKRGDFYGVNEEIHLHVLPDEQAFIINLFNLSDKPKNISGRFYLEKARLKKQLMYNSSQPWAQVKDDTLKVSRQMPPWSAEVAYVTAKQ